MLERIADLGRKFWPWLILAVAAAVVATSVYFAIDKYGGTWWDARDRWDLISAIAGAVLGGATVLALLHEYFRRKSTRDAVTAHVVRAEVRQTNEEGKSVGELTLYVELRGALTYAPRWRILDPTLIRLIGLDDEPIQKHRPVSYYPDRATVGFVMSRVIPIERAHQLVAEVAGRPSVTSVAALQVKTDHREFDEPPSKCLLEIHESLRAASTAVVTIEEVRRVERENAMDAAKSANEEALAAEVMKRARLKHCFARAYLEAPLVRVSGLGQAQLAFTLVVDSVIQDINNGAQLMGATIKLIDPHARHEIAFAVVRGEQFHFKQTRYEAEVVTTVEVEHVALIHARTPHIPAAIAVSEDKDCVVQYRSTIIPDSGAIYNVQLDPRPVPLRIHGEDKL